VGTSLPRNCCITGANNFRAFFHAHPEIRLIGFNGGTAAKLYQRHVIPTLTDGQRAMATTTLPSSSPAHAGLSFVQKAGRWSDVLGEAHSNKANDGPSRP
jgi:TDG/mug DNA glycosylase family protein